LLGNLEFRNPRGLSKCWGSSRPPELEVVFAHLKARGFLGPLSWTNPLNFSFDRAIDSDLFVRAVVNRVGEHPARVFNFDTTILVCSKSIAEIECKLDLWERRDVSVDYEGNSRYSALLSVTLSHLKWNAVQGANPKWSVMASQSDAPAELTKWEADWDAYGQPFLDQFADAESIANFLFHLDRWRRSPWVKSDGPLSAARYEFAAILLYRIGMSKDAEYILTNVLSQITTAMQRVTSTDATRFLERRLNKILDWGRSISVQ
jgi:hypothetical protein